jgi:hypothetical protein
VLMADCMAGLSSVTPSPTAPAVTTFSVVPLGGMKSAASIAIENRRSRERWRIIFERGAVLILSWLASAWMLTRVRLGTFGTDQAVSDQPNVKTKT